MANVYQNLTFSFAQGLDTKSDPFQTPFGKLSELENCVFSKQGQLQKRNGYRAISKVSTDSGSQFQTAKAMDVYEDDLILYDGLNAYVYSDSIQRWFNKGPLTSINVSNATVVRNTYQQTNPDMARNVAAGIEVYAWDDSRGMVRYSTRDINTGLLTSNDIALPDGSNTPRCVAVGNNTAVFYLTGGVLSYALISTIRPDIPFIQSPGITLDSSFQHYDIIADSDDSKVWLAYAAFGSQQAYLASFDANTFQMTSYGGKSGIASRNISLAEANVDANHIMILAANNSGLQLTGIDAAGTELGSVTLTSDNNIKHTTAINQSTILSIYYDTTDEVIKYMTYDLHSGALVSPVILKRSLELSHRTFIQNGRRYIPTIHDSPLQSTYFLLDENGSILSKQQQNVGKVRSNSLLGNVIRIDSNNLTLAESKQGVFFAQNEAVFTYAGVVATLLDYNSVNTYHSAVLADTLHVVSGALRMYDGGSRFVEHGFLLFPEGIVANDGYAGSIPNGTYQWVFTYEWTDNKGQIHRSAPSIPIQKTLVGPANSQIFNFPTLRITEKMGVRLVAYRTQRLEDVGQNAIFYRVSSITSPLINDTSVDSLTFIDTLDNTINSNDPIYTTGGVVPNSPAPNCGLVTTYRNRLFIADLDDKNTIWFSQSIVPGEPVSFSDELQIQMDPRGGGITALGWMDNNLIIFKENQIYAVTGEGPTNTGQQNDYNDPQLISSNVGCISPDSVVTAGDLGLMFQSKNGIWLLNRGLSVSYVGAPVERYNNQTIVSSQLIPHTTQIRFMCNDGKALMYDYFFNQWGTFTGPITNAVDAGIWENQMVFINSFGRIYVETENVYTDNNIPVNFKVTTAWVNFSGINNYHLVRRMLLIGDYKGRHVLTIKRAYNYIEAFDTGTVIDTATVLGNLAWGEPVAPAGSGPYGIGPFGLGPFGTGTANPTPDETWGGLATWGGPFQLEQFRISPTLNGMSNKMQAIKLEITETESEPNAAVNLSALTFEVGVKKGLAKIRPSKHF